MQRFLCFAALACVVNGQSISELLHRIRARRASEMAKAGGDFQVPAARHVAVSAPVLARRPKLGLAKQSTKVQEQTRQTLGAAVAQQHVRSVAVAHVQAKLQHQASARLGIRSEVMAEAKQSKQLAGYLGWHFEAEKPELSFSTEWKTTGANARSLETTSNVKHEKQALVAQAVDTTDFDDMLTPADFPSMDWGSPKAKRAPETPKVDKISNIRTNSYLDSVGWTDSSHPIQESASKKKFLGATEVAAHQEFGSNSFLDDIMMPDLKFEVAHDAELR